jgi:hypothetical protein
VIKDEGFWVEVPGPSGSVVAHFSAYDPHLGCEEGADLELFLLADDHEAALDRARGFGILHPAADLSKRLGTRRRLVGAVRAGHGR